MRELRTVGDVYPSEWLRAADLRGRAVRVMVARVEVREFRGHRGGEKENKIVVGFAGKKKRLICNVTQARAFAVVCGSDVFLEWRGQSVVLAPGRASNGKETIVVHGAEGQGEMVNGELLNGGIVNGGGGGGGENV